jgi:RNA polymerase sigma factor (sigma-70 family)
MTGPADILRRLDQAGPADRDLIVRFATLRDQAAFAELVRRHGPLVYGVCRRVTGQAEDAEDAFQAVFLVLARKAGRIGNPDLLGNWLYGVAVRVASKARRSASRRRAREVAVSPLPDPPSAPASAISELGPILDEELAGLPEWYREAILLCDLRGVSREEAAALLGVPEGTLSSRLANGRKKLAARLARRGVSLSVSGLAGVVGQAQAVTTVPNQLVAKTCGLVENWSAGGAVPDPLARLAEGGFAVRKTLLFGVLVVAAAAGAVVAAGSGDQTRRVPRLEPDLKDTEGGMFLQTKKKENRDTLEYKLRLKMMGIVDVPLVEAQVSSWSHDGTSLLILGRQKYKDGLPNPEGELKRVIMVYREIEGRNRKPSRRDLVVGEYTTITEFGCDSRIVITDKRESHLVSGLHQLSYWEFVGEGGEGSGLRHTRTTDLDSDETQGYAFSADGKTFRTIAFERDGSGQPKKIEVREVDASSGKTLKLLLRTDYAQYLLSSDGRRLATLEKDGKVATYDVDRGAKHSAHALPEPPSLPPMSGTAAANFGQAYGGSLRSAVGSFLVFSPDASKLVVSRTIGQTVVIDTITGKPLAALEGSEMMQTYPAPHAFTGDGRLLAMTGLHYTIGKGPVRGFGQKGGREQEVLSPGRRFLTVWDTQTGKVLKSWDRAPLVAFNPARPVLAILEPNGENTTRLGLWDFSAEVEKK